MVRKNGAAKTWWPSHIKGANAQWDPLAGIGAFASAWMLEHRVLFLMQSIRAEDTYDEESWSPGVSSLIASLLMLDATEPGRKITLYINSPGGDVPAGLSLIQVMRDLRSPVHTFVLMQAASMAAVVAVAGVKRYAYPTARWLLHRDYGVAAGDHEDLLIAAKELRRVDKMADQVLLNFSQIKADRLESMQRKDYWLGVREAQKWGLIDDVVTPKQGPEYRQWLPEGGRGGTVSGIEG